MRHEDYIRSRKPLWLALWLLLGFSPLPLGILLTEGFHSGVAYSFLVVAEFGIFLPGITLLPRKIVLPWLIVCLPSVLVIVVMFIYYLRQAPDWMDAEIPSAFLVLSQGVAWGSRLYLWALGALGWLRYFRRCRLAST